MGSARGTARSDDLLLSEPVKFHSVLVKSPNMPCIGNIVFYTCVCVYTVGGIR